MENEPQTKESSKLTGEQQRMIEVFVKALPKLRKQLGVSQTVLGEKIGISRQMVSFIERGVCPMTWSTFLSIALFFKVNYNADRDRDAMTDLDRFLLVEPGAKPDAKPDAEPGVKSGAPAGNGR